MNEKMSDFPQQDPLQLLRSPQARLLMEQLQQMDPEILQRAANLAAGGNTEKAKALLRSELKTDDTDPLIREMEGPHGRF